jgi:hypothetical protein
MNSFSVDIEPGVESDLIDVDDVPFTTLLRLDSEPLRRSLGQVVERTSMVRAAYRSTNAGGGERID